MLSCGLSWRWAASWRAARDAQAASDTPGKVDDRTAICLGDGAHLAAFNTGAAASTCIGVDHGEVVGLRHGVFDAPLGDPAQQATATAAAVADVARALRHVAHRVHQADLFDPVEEVESFRARDRPVRGAGLPAGEPEAGRNGELAAPPTELVLLDAADAVLKTEGLGSEQELPDVVVGEHPLLLDCRTRRHGAMDGRLRRHEGHRPAGGEVLLDETRELRISGRQHVGLIRSHDEGREPVATPSGRRREPHQAALHQ